jgi:hypothetical protein
MKFSRLPRLSFFVGVFALVAWGGAAESGEWVPLLDSKLSKWEVFTGVPHTSVEGLPAGTYQSEEVREGTPIGLGKDPKTVYSTYEEGGATILHVSGEIYAGLSSLEDFENYHLRLKVRWGDQKWEPRLKDKRDSGILYHCHGPHGASWAVWKSSLEYQIQEGDMGDLITVFGTRVKAPYLNQGKRKYYDTREPYQDWKGYLNTTLEQPDMPHGEWNVVDLYVVGDQAIHVINGRAVMSLKDALDKDGKPLTKGSLQIQSEGAEVEYKEIEIRQISDFPKALKNGAKL